MAHNQSRMQVVTFQDASSFSWYVCRVDVRATVARHLVAEEGVETSRLYPVPYTLHLIAFTFGKIFAWCSSFLGFCILGVLTPKTNCECGGIQK